MSLRICLLLDKRYPLERPWTPKIVELFFRFLPKHHKLTVIMPTRKFAEGIINYNKNLLIYLVPSKTFLNTNILKKLKFIIQCHRRSKFDLIHVRNGIIDGFIGIYLRRKYSLPFVYELTFPLGLKLQRHRLYEQKLRNIYLILGKIREFLSLKIMSEADLIIPQSKFMKAYLSRKRIYKKKMLPHSMGVNIDLFTPRMPSEKVKELLNLEGSQVLIYIGNMNRMRKLDFLINCFFIIKSKFENVKLLMIGTGNDRTNLENLVRKLHLQNDVIFTGQIPYTEVPNYIGISDIGLSPLPPDPVFLMSSPTKIFEYMAMAKPVIASDIPEQREILLKSRAGIYVSFREKKFSEAICYLLKNTNEAREMGLKGREFVSTYHSYDYLSKKMLAWYEKLKKLRQ